MLLGGSFTRDQTSMLAVWRAVSSWLNEYDGALLVECGEHNKLKSDSMMRKHRPFHRGHPYLKLFEQTSVCSKLTTAGTRERVYLFLLCLMAITERQGPRSLCAQRAHSVRAQRPKAIKGLHTHALAERELELTGCFLCLFSSLLSLPALW